MPATTAQQDLPAKIEEEAPSLDHETPASANPSRPVSSYAFPDFNPPSSRPPSSYNSQEQHPTFSLFPKPRAFTSRPTRGSKPPVAFRTRSSSCLLDEYFAQPKRRGTWHDTDELNDTGEPVQRHNIRDMERETIAELVDFLRNHAPPPENFMSIPDDDGDNADRGRWLKLQPFTNRRSKSAPKASKPLKLPDSAVAGRTIGGHRHIAISIPIEHSPFGSNPSSQYPVYGKDGEPHTEPDAVMRFTDSNGMVTVLRRVSESQESVTGNTSPQKIHRPVSVTAEPLRSPVSRSQSLNGPRDYATASLPPTPLTHSRSCHLDSKTGGDAAAKARRGTSPTPGPTPAEAPVATKASAAPGRPRPMPRRWSALAIANQGQVESIDGIMYGRRRQPASATVQQPVSGAGTCSGGLGSSTGPSSGSNKARTKANVAKVVPTIKVSSNRDSIMDWQGQVHDPVAEETEGRTSTETPSLSRRSCDSRQSRKEKVRQRKKRDIEASRASWGRKKAGADDASLGRSSMVSEASHDVKGDHESDHTEGSRSTLGGSPSLTPVIIVADLKPSSPPSPTAIASPIKSNFGPPLVHRGRSPARSFEDRTFLSTRPDYRHASLAIRSTVSPARFKHVSPDRRAYEERLSEIEQRMRKLESHGDVWMKSVAPILDTLNRTLAGFQDEQQALCLEEEKEKQRIKTGGEEEEVKKPNRVILPRKKLTRRSTLNEKMLLDLRRIEKGEVEIIKDGSGLESVMRELQQTSAACSPVRRDESLQGAKPGIAI